MATTNTSKSSSKSSNANGTSKKGNVTTLPAAKKPTEQTAPAAQAAPAAQRGDRNRRLPLARRIERQMALVLKRWGNINRKAKGWNDEMDTAMGNVGTAIGEAIVAAKAIPDTFVPQRRARGEGGRVRPLAEGQYVDVTDKAMAHYKDIIDEEDLKGLRVKRVVGKKVIFATKSGVNVILPRGHVRPVATASSAHHDDQGTHA